MPGAAEGFNVMPDALPSGFDDFAEQVIPELLSRGLFSNESPGTTLREHLGLSRPAASSCLEPPVLAFLRPGDRKDHRDPPHQLLIVEAPAPRGKGHPQPRWSTRFRQPSGLAALAGSSSLSQILKLLDVGGPVLDPGILAGSSTADLVARNTGCGHRHQASRRPARRDITAGTSRNAPYNLARLLSPSTASPAAG